ncbi:MAG: hypothetical protein M1148_04045 [Candidatus Thermoplasmatota archaeon]|nr:hypothetical protein [Candidatus Thermoplasmatota archaeon]
MDTGLTISMEQKHPVLPLLLKEVDTIPLDFHVSGGEGFIDLFMCGRVAEKITGLVEGFHPERRGDCLILSIPAEEMKTATSIMDEISEVSSQVRTGLYLRGSGVYIDYRVHSSAADNVTRIVGRIIGMGNRIRVSDLGPSPGGIAAIDSVDSRIHLGVVSYEADILEETGLPLDRDFYMEYNFNRQEEKGFRALAYDGDGFSVRHLRSRFLDDVHRLSLERRIPKAAILARTLEGRYMSSTFVPFSMMDDQLSILYSASEKHPDAKFRLVAVRSYDRSVWGWV